jgi:hypothetical protein
MGRVRRLPPSLVPMVALGAVACSTSLSPSPRVDAAAIGDAARDASHRPPDPPGYDYWWFPECETADGSCPGNCFRNPIVAIPDRCGPYLNLEVGCVPRSTTVLTDWFCVMRESNGELIYTEVSPLGGDWAECTNTLGNLPPAREGALCFDAGAAD